MYMYGNIKDGLLIIRFTMVYHITHLLPNGSRKQILGIPELAKSTTEPFFSVVFISMVCLLLTVVIYLSLSQSLIIC